MLLGSLLRNKFADGIHSLKPLETSEYVSLRWLRKNIAGLDIRCLCDLGLDWDEIDESACSHRLWDRLQRQSLEAWEYFREWKGTDLEEAYGWE